MPFIEATIVSKPVWKAEAIGAVKALVEVVPAVFAAVALVVDALLMGAVLVSKRRRCR
jgi:hypothetical protein